ncbi:CLIP domain-containing serine protease 14D-like [Chelonus insularis]|uniref:CLIP domain-containing serine protease 14D-like n=1 Tax=Chelonus insularis TaxID=460826 RepID=UPI00158BA8E6|nr:CLIP domain-containing serine protease 14D-like [Chelonus insularis]
MVLKYLYLFSLITLTICDYEDYFPNGQLNNVLACAKDKVCVPLDCCPEIANLLMDDTLPVHRFRQAVCGYSGINPKVCCNNPTDIVNFGAIPNEHKSENIRQRQCGYSLVKSDYAGIGSYPFLARIGFINLDDGEIKYSCSGAIINERTVVTTASCALATSDDYKIHSVLIGEYDTKTDPDCNSLFCAHRTTSHNISYIIKHPGYRAETFDKNIALIRLNESIDFSLTAMPVCYSERPYVSTGVNTVLVGWGKLLNTKDITEQGIVPMKILPLQDCEDYLMQGLTVELCAMGPQEPCSGYSGSPLLYRERECYTLIGLLSHGTSCDSNRNTPSAFVSIRKYAQWITENS